MVSWILISVDINNTASEEQILNKQFLVKEEVTANMISYFRQIFNDTLSATTGITGKQSITVIWHTATKQPHFKPHKFKDCKNSEKQTVPLEYVFVSGSIKECVMVKPILLTYSMRKRTVPLKKTENKCDILRTAHLHQSTEELSQFRFI